MSKHWNDEMIELEKRVVAKHEAIASMSLLAHKYKVPYVEAKVVEPDNLTGCQRVDAEQSVAMEGWDLRWEIERLNLMLKAKETEITALKYDRAMLKAELNSIRGRKV